MMESLVKRYADDIGFQAGIKKAEDAGFHLESWQMVACSAGNGAFAGVVIIAVYRHGDRP